MPAQSFNALNGKELVEVILDTIREKLEKTGEFPQGLTFPWVHFTFNVSVLSYPKQDRNAEPGIKVEGSEGSGEPAPAEASETRVSHSEIIDTPDKARVEHKLPVPTPSPSSGKVFVDKPIHRGGGKK